MALLSWTPSEDEFLRTNYRTLSYGEISKNLGRRTEGAVKRRAWVIGAVEHKRYGNKKNYVDLSFFSLPRLENSYWAGFIAADGCIDPPRNRVVIALHLSDKEHLRSFATAISFDGPIRVCRNDRGYGNPGSFSARIEICGASQWVRDLKANFEITPRKSKTLKPPERLNRSNSLAFIVGYIDGDGSITKSYGLKAIKISGTIETLEWIKSIFDQLAPTGWRRELSKVCTSGKFPDYKVHGERAKKILGILVALPVPKLYRKWGDIVSLDTGG